MTKEVLKLALDALETELSIDWTNNDEFNASAEKMHKAIAAIKEALAQPEQEPVALEKERKAFEEWIDSRFINKGHAAFCKFSDRDAYYIDEIQNKWKAWKERAKRTPTTPQRTWVKLEGEEIRNLWEEATKPDRSTMTMVTSFARAIEAKLKQKNGYAEEKNT